MSEIPQVKDYMTRTSKTVGSRQPLCLVNKLMKSLGMQYMPVRMENEIVGIISQRSVTEAMTNPNGNRLAAQDVMMKNPVSISPDMPLDQIAERMAEGEYRSVLVRDKNGELIGMFTTADACRVLGQVLQHIYLGLDSTGPDWGTVK